MENIKARIILLIVISVTCLLLSAFSIYCAYDLNRMIKNKNNLTK